MREEGEKETGRLRERGEREIERVREGDERENERRVQCKEGEITIIYNYKMEIVAENFPRISIADFSNFY